MKKSMYEVLDSFIDSFKIKRSGSKDSLDAYYRDIARFIAYLIDHGFSSFDEVKKDDVLDYHREKVKKAYPAYFDTYSEIDTLINYLNKFDNLYCVGRNGQHRYNNMDHSMITSFEAVNNIINGVKNKDNIWNVNTEQEYHEEKK